MKKNKDYVIGSGFTGNKVREQMDVSYSTLGQLQCINHILKTSNNYDRQQSNSDLLTVHQTMDSNKNKLIENTH